MDGGRQTLDVGQWAIKLDAVTLAFLENPRSGERSYKFQMLHLPLISSDLWKAIDDPAARIDRVLTDRSYRLSIGLDVDQDLRTMQCTLVMTSGHGKYLRVRHAVGSQIELPKLITESWGQLKQTDPLPLLKYRQFIADLADLQIQAIEQVKRKAGKYVDRILFVSVSEPGVWLNDFDGSKIYSGLTDSQRIADATGLTVVDDYPANDVSAGGRGGPLSALPLWLTFSDRNAKVADEHRVVLLLNEMCEGYLVPASEGVDAELPRIRTIRSPGKRFFRGLIEALRDHCRDDQEALKQSSSTGKVSESLKRNWAECEGCEDDQSQRFKSAVDAVDSKKLSVADVLKTAIDFAVGACLEQVRRGGNGLAYYGPQPASSNIRHVYVFGDAEITGPFLDYINQSFPQETIFTQTPEAIDGHNVRGLVAALLGILHVDQMQANVPWITGADQQRILGKLTPGSPSNWRQLVRDMSDFRPPAMKLRDAI